jgi:undecaprenyl-diphosphatase
VPHTAPYLPILSYFQTLILGFIQGLTEYLPVSSTAHMRIIPALLHWPDPGAAFSAIVQLGPIFAVITYFRRDIVKYIAGIGRSLQQRVLFPPGDTNARLGWFTLLGTIPLIIFGLALEKKIDGEYRNLYFVSAALIVLAFVLLIAESRARQTVTLKKITFRQAMLIGLSQALAIVPGASRSGCTITAGLFLGLNREDAAKFSFLLSIPAITLAGLYKLAKTLAQTHGAHLSTVLGPYIFGSVVAGFVAYVVIALFLGYLQNERHTTMPFIIYRILLGVALLVLVSLHFVVPQSH